MIFLISVAIILSGPDFDVNYLLVPSTEMFSSANLIVGILCLIVFPLIKDMLFGNASIGKRIMRLKVINADTGNSPSIISLIIRNITFYIPPVELFSFLANNGMTIGDKISHTTVVDRSKTNFDI